MTFFHKWKLLLAPINFLTYRRACYVLAKHVNLRWECSDYTSWSFSSLLRWKAKGKEEDYFSLLLREEYSQFYIELVFRATLPFILTLKNLSFSLTWTKKVYMYSYFYANQFFSVDHTKYRNSNLWIFFACENVTPHPQK